MADHSRTAAEAKFKKQQKIATEAERALNEYEAARGAALAKTERLRALRLAKEAEEQAAAPAKKPRRAKRPAR